MGSECNLSKRRYDITMSKRTRKPLNLENPTTTTTIVSPKKESPIKGFLDRADEDRPAKVDDGDNEEEEEEDKDHKSLKQLINGINEATKVNVKVKVKSSSSDDNESRGRSSLGQHFTEEEAQLQLARKDKKPGMKLKGMVGRYVKVLSHLIKNKRHPHIGSRKRHLL